MNIFKSVLAFFAMLLSAMFGGQKNKAARRYVAPGVAMGFAASIKWRWKYLAFLLWIPIFSLGYGVDSQLGALLGHIEWLIRLAYALLVSLPFFIFGPLRWVISAVLLVIAFQVRAGSLGYTAGFGDWLIEDIVRYGTWALIIIFNVLFDRN